MSTDTPATDPREVYDQHREQYDEWANLDPDDDHERLLKGVGEAIRAAARQKSRGGE
jgi:hypothetical protein